MIAPRQTLQTLSAYHPPLEGRGNAVRLDFNENTTGVAVTGLPNAVVSVYPEYQAFMEQLAAAWQLPTECLVLTNGSDEALYIIANAYIEPKQDTALVMNPTFALIPHYLKLCDANLLELPYGPSLQYDIAAIETALQSQPIKLAMFASPDNPTGALLPQGCVEKWCQQFPNTLFVIDEAYAEYTGQSVVTLTQQYANLLVTKTFSKAWGLAGLRLGVVIGQAALLKPLKLVQSPYSVNMAAVYAAGQVLPQQASVLAEAQKTMAIKQTAVQQLRDLGVVVYDGAAHFMLLSFGILADEYTKYCATQGLLVRNQSSRVGLWGLVRVSTGTQVEMKRLIEITETFIKTHAIIFDMDGTLIDTSRSFDVAIEKMIAQHAPTNPLKPGELEALRVQGGFNDDWESIRYLLQQRGVAMSYDDVANEALKLFLQIAPDVETWYTPPEKISQLKKRYALGVATGRFRPEFNPIWKDRFEAVFATVICQDDDPKAAKKPAPDIIEAAKTQLGATGGVYVGNSVDDMHAAVAAGLTAIGITTTQPKEALVAAGAKIIIESLDELETVMGGLV